MVPLVSPQGSAGAFCSFNHCYQGHSTVFLRTPRVGAPKASLRYPSFHLALFKSDSIKVSAEETVEAVATAL